ncbi:MAG TPA: nucleotidyltransferase family protein [Actinomycetota bacterium]|nr:nucleotidyltransferase family protein [Actinomycetota bacterium]
MITGIVLAAGTSSRFGRTKQLLELEGKPLVQHAVDAATAAGLDEVVVVLGHDAERVGASLLLPASGRTVLNPSYEAGQSTSLIAGLNAAGPESDAAVVLLADQPGITPQHLRALVETFEAGRPSIVRLRFRDGPGPALLSREVWDEARRLAGDTGAREIIAAHPGWVKEVVVESDAPVDVDRPPDLERLP